MGLKLTSKLMLYYKLKKQKTTQEKKQEETNELQRVNSLNYFFGYLSIKSINILI